MKKGDKIEARGYPKNKEEDKEVFPSFLEPGEHQISIMKRTGWGLLMKTDRHPRWINVNWFLTTQKKETKS